MRYFCERYGTDGNRRAGERRNPPAPRLAPGAGAVPPRFAVAFPKVEFQADRVTVQPSPHNSAVGCPGRRFHLPAPQPARSVCLRRFLWIAGIAGAMLAAPNRSVAAPRRATLAISVPASAGFGLAGPEDARQLLVTERRPDGRVRDRTSTVRYVVAPAGVVAVHAGGWVTPLRDGAAQIRAVDGGVRTAPIRVTVRGLSAPAPVSFRRLVVPVLAKAGCSGGVCHGRTGGQNGFRLSLFGFEPEDDYGYLVREGARVVPARPGESLLLRKATASVPHAGGKRFGVGSVEYRLLARWMREGARDDPPDAPRLHRLEMTPAEVVLPPGAEQQMAVLAHYTDGSSRDVTRLAQFEVNLPNLRVSDTGRVSVGPAPGAAAVMARVGTDVAVMQCVVPLVRAAPMPAPTPHESGNAVDRLVFRRLRMLGLTPSPPASDRTFIRRVTLDVAGRLPTPPETQAFLTDTSPGRDARLVDRLLADPGYADLFAARWSALLRNRRDSGADDPAPTAAFHGWLRDNFARDRPFAELARDVLTAQGAAPAAPPVLWYREVRDASAQAEDTAQLFLGVRIACARCHHHPQERWNQHDYTALAAFFSRLKIEDPPAPPQKRGEPKPVKPPFRVELAVGAAVLPHPRTGHPVPAAPLGLSAAPAAAAADARQRLADWLADPGNPYFARTAVNRVWKQFLGRGLVEPEDDFRLTNPPTNPELLDTLAAEFRQSGGSLKQLVRRICTSRVYRLSSESHAQNRADTQSYARFYPRRLPAEVLLDALDQVTGSRTRFPGLPEGTRAVQVPDNQTGSYFLSVFGRPDGTSACECERRSEATLAQSLHLLNSPEVLAKVAGPRAAALAADPRTHRERLRTLYQLALAREPIPAEEAVLLPRLQFAEPDRGAVQRVYEDVIWAVLSTREFLFVR